MSAAFDVADPASVSAVRFLLTADADPGLLPRLLQPFARRDLTPDHLRLTRIGETLEVEIGMEAMPADMVHLVAGNLGQVVGVRRIRQHGRGAKRCAEGHPTMGH